MQIASVFNCNLLLEFFLARKEKRAKCKQLLTGIYRYYIAVVSSCIWQLLLYEYAAANDDDDDDGGCQWYSTEMQKVNF